MKLALIQQRVILSFILINLISSLSSQSFVKKDSSEMVPFLHKLYFSADFDSSVKPLDRLYFNHRVHNVGMNQNFSGLTGTIGSSLVPVLHDNVFYQNVKLGRALNDPYFYTSKNIPYFALNKPISELDFTFFGNGNEEFNGFLSQNLSRAINLGIGIRRTNNKGFFLNQENTHNNLYAYIVHNASRLRTNLEFVFNEMNLKESGGYNPDIYQSSIAPGQWAATNPKLAIARNQLKNYQINFRYRYLLLGIDSFKDNLLFTPKSSRLYIDHQIQKFSDRHYYSDTVNTGSRVEYGVLTSSATNQLNSLSLHSGLQSDFRLNYQANGLKISGYNILSDNTLEVGTKFGEYLRSYDYLNLGLGLDVIYQVKSNLTFVGKGYKSFLGYTENDFKLFSEIQATFPNIFTQSWISYNHQKPSFISSLNYTPALDTFYNLSTQKTLEAGFGFNMEKFKFSGRVQYFAIADFMTYDSVMRPQQVQNNFIQLYLKKEWSYKWFYFPTEVFYQNSIFQRGMIRQMFAFKNKLFSEKNNVLVGAELSLNFNYNTAHYSSFFMSPVLTETMSEAAIFPKLDLFATFKISKVHFSLVMDNFLSSYLKTGINYVHNHPMTPSAFYLRMNWRFLE
jgi:hypothetical protein